MPSHIPTPCTSTARSASTAPSFPYPTSDWSLSLSVRDFPPTLTASPPLPPHIPSLPSFLPLLPKGAYYFEKSRKT